MRSTHDRQACVHRKPFAVFEYVGNRKFFLAIARRGNVERGIRIPSVAGIRSTGVSYLPVVPSTGRPLLRESCRRDKEFKLKVNFLHPVPRTPPPYRDSSPSHFLSFSLRYLADNGCASILPIYLLLLLPLVVSAHESHEPNHR